MAIRELSHERRNIMIPRYWRHCYGASAGASVNLTTSGAQVQFPGAEYDHTIITTEDSIVRIQFQGMLDRYAGVDSWDQTLMYIRDVTNGVDLGGTGGFVYYTAGGANRASYATIAVLGFKNHPAGPPGINYQIQYYSWTASELRIMYPSISIDICRD